MPISQFNNWNAPLAGFGFPGDVFNGSPEPTGTASAISVNILCSTQTTLTIQQSYNTSNFYYQQQYQIQGGELSTIQMPVVLPYFRVNILNDTMTTQTYCNMNTSLVPQLTQSVDIRPLTSATDSVSIGNFPANNQMTTTATRAVSFLVLNTWYRVATVGNTSGAVWAEIGAIVDGESEPAIGRLFKCAYVPSSVAGEGTCYDVEYNDNTVSSITGTVSLGAGTESVGTVRIRDAYGDPILTTAGNLMVGINNIYTANPLHTIIDSGSVTFTEASASVVSLSTITNTHQDIKNSAGTLKSILITYDNAIAGIVAYVKLYDNLSPTGTSTPKIILPVVSGTTIQFDCHNLAFATGITIRNVDSFGNSSSPPSGTLYATVLYN